MLKKLEREDWGDQVLWPARGANLTTRCSTVDWPMETCDNGNQCIHMHFTVTAFKRPFDVEIRNCYTDPGDKPLFMFVKNPNFAAWVQFCNATLCNTLTTDELKKDTRDPVMLKKLQYVEWGDEVIGAAEGANLTTHCGTVDGPIETCDNGNQCIHMHFTVTAFKRPFDVAIRNCFSDVGYQPLLAFIKEANFTKWVQYCNDTLCNTLTTDELKKATRGAANATSTIM
ncbi:unnamed protein product, partial [Mesorhabditis spiculigera]